MSFVPAGMTLWGYSERATLVRHVLLGFDSKSLQETFGESVDPLRAQQPRLCFTDPRLWTLAALVADDDNAGDPAAQLYTDGLITAIAGLLFASRQERTKAKGAVLTPRQLRHVLEYMETNLPRRVALATLAKMVDLSLSHFSHAFKSSTGCSPYQWQIHARVAKAKDLLISRRETLDEIAELTGFADAVHFGRTFRRIVGTTPANWRRRYRNTPLVTGSSRQRSGSQFGVGLAQIGACDCQRADGGEAAKQIARSK